MIVVAAALFAVESVLLCRKQSGERYWHAPDREVASMIDQLKFIDTADAFKAGKMRNIELVKAADAPARIRLDDKEQKGYPRDGTWTTRQIRTEFPITELLPSWNVITPDQTGVVFHVRTRDQATQQWSPWLHIGQWGRINDKVAVGECEFGWIDEDTLKLYRPADAYELRATLQSFVPSLKISASIRRIAITYSGPMSEGSAFARAMRPDPGPVERWARDIPVPFITQQNNDFAVTGMTCSPTSVSMVLQHLGVNCPTATNIYAIWDDHNEMFGNWANNTQRASELGMDAWLQRFRNWEQVKAMIAQGQPIVASIKFEKGSYPDHPYDDSTGGHLIVIRGLTADGNVIVNDPGTRKGERTLWPQQGLVHAWFGHGGVGYVIRPPAKPLPAELVKSFPTTQPVARGSN